MKTPCLTVYLKQTSQRVAPPTEAFTVLNKPCGVEYLRVYSHCDCDFESGKEISHSYTFRQLCGYFHELGSIHSEQKGKILLFVIFLLMFPPSLGVKGP